MVGLAVMSWRKVNMVLAGASALLWVLATYTDWINSIKFVSHVSMATMVFTFVAAWRADEPTTCQEKCCKGR